MNSYVNTIKKPGPMTLSFLVSLMGMRYLVSWLSQRNIAKSNEITYVEKTCCDLKCYYLLAVLNEFYLMHIVRS